MFDCWAVLVQAEPPPALCQVIKLRGEGVSHTIGDTMDKVSWSKKIDNLVLLVLLSQEISAPISAAPGWGQKGLSLPSSYQFWLQHVFQSWFGNLKP